MRITMDWKVERRRMVADLKEETPQSTSERKSTYRIGSSPKLKRSTLRTTQLLSIGIVLLVVLCQSPPASCFFFPQSLFRRLSPTSSSQHQQQQQQQQHQTAPSRDSRLVASPSEQQQVQVQQPGLRIVNNNSNRPFGNEPAGQPNPNFHVPKALCIACERFPWMPVAGSEQQPAPADQNSAKSVNNPEIQPANTIVISALGEAKDPISLPQSSANRKPFAIQFDSVQSQNNVGSPPPPPQQQQQQQQAGIKQQSFKEYTPTEENNQNRDPATRPITFQIYDPPRQQQQQQQPTILRPVGGGGNQQQQPQQQQQQQSGGNGGYYNEPAPFMQPPPSQGYQFRPVQIPQQQMFFMQPQLSYRPTVLQPVSQSYGMVPPPPPVQQQGGGYNFPPRNIPQQQQQQSQKQPKSVGPPPNSPIPPITISTIVAAQHGGQQRPQQQQQGQKQFSQGPTTFHGIVPAKLVYQEHSSEIRPQNIAPFKNQPQIQYGKPFPPQQQQPQQRPFINQQQQQRPQNHGYLPPSQPPQNRPPSYLPPAQSQQFGGGGKSVGNQYIINLRPPMQQNLGGYAPPPGQRPPPPPSGQVYFPNQVQQQNQQQQIPQQYGQPPQITAQNQQQQPQSVSGVENQGSTGNNEVKYGQPNASQQSSNIVPIPVPSSESSPSSSSTSGGDYHQSGSSIQNQRENPSNNFIPPPPPQSGSGSGFSKVPFNPPKGVVKNPHIQSIENVQPPNPTTVPAPPSTSTQENGWEIIPAVQTDITHLFQNPPQPTEQTKQVQQQQQKQGPVVNRPAIIPLPVPIPIPESHASKSPVFVVHNQGNRPLAPNDPKIHGNIVVQGITYHEEQKNKQGGGGQVQQPQPQSSQQSTQSAPPPPGGQNNNVLYNNNQQKVPSPPPQVQSHQQQQGPQAPLHPQQIMLRPHPGSQFDPLPASISTALYHAQRTSYLTHQYWQSNANANGNGGPGGGRTVYVHSVPVIRPQYPQVQVSNNGLGGEGGRDASSPVASDSNINSVEDGNADQQQQENNKDNINSHDQTAVNCQNHQQWVHSQPPNQQQQIVQPSQIVQQQQQQRQPYLMYYRPPPPPPVQQQQSSIFWIQPSQQTQQHVQHPTAGILRHRPQGGGEEQQQSIIGDESRPVFSKPVYEWSKVVGQSQSHTVNENRNQAPPRQEEESHKTQTSSGGSNKDVETNDKGSSEEEQSSYSINIPFGEKLSKRPTVTPFDIISVGGKDESQVQSLEEENVEQQSNNYNSNSNGNNYHSQQPQEPGSGSSEHHGGGGGSYEGQDVSQEVSQDNNNNGRESSDEQNSLQTGQQDIGERPTLNPNYILRPVSTTIIHSPEASSYSSQSFGSQGFRPQKVIVHDFTKGVSSSVGGSEDSNPVPSPSFSVPQEENYGQPSQNVHSWQAFNNNNGAVRGKSPKLVDEEYHQQVVDDDEDEEDKQSLASVANSKIVQYQNVVTGLMTPAECATAHSHPILLTASTNQDQQSIRGGGGGDGGQIIMERLAGNKNRGGEKVDKVRYILGSRFPAGRPAITSFNAWTTTPSTTTSSSSTTEIPVDYEQGSLENGDHSSQHPGGSASISIPVYRPPNHETPSSRYHLSHTRFTNSRWSPPKNVILDDIYTTSEVKQQSLETGGIGPITTITSTDNQGEEDKAELSSNNNNSHHPTEVTTEATTTTEVTTEDDTHLLRTSMSTEKSSSFSISVEGGGGGEKGNSGATKSGSSTEAAAEPTARKVPSGNDGQKLEIRFSPSVDVGRPVFIVTSAPVSTTTISQEQIITSTDSATTPSPQSTSTKIVKTVRVRQRMRPGSFGVKNRFHGNGTTTRVRVVHHRPAVPEYVRHFPELVTAENEKLGKHEEEEIKNALIELKRTN